MMRIAFDEEVGLERIWKELCEDMWESAAIY